MNHFHLSDYIALATVFGLLLSPVFITLWSILDDVRHNEWLKANTLKR